MSGMQEDGSRKRLMLNEGDMVQVYYRREYQHERYKFFCSLSRNMGVFRPRFGMSDGWVSACVTRDFDEAEFDQHNPNTTGVYVDFTWPLWYNHRGFLLDDLSDVIPPDRIRRADPDIPRYRPCVAHQPSLGLLVVRWGGIQSPAVPSQWGSSGPSISDVFIGRMIDHLSGGTGRNDVEVWSVFVESSDDIRKFADSAHLMLHSSHPLMRCKRVFACYHLYPTSFSEFSHPYLETGEDNGAGYIESRSVFDIMHAVERCDIPTLFPHPSNLYDLLASKRWTHLLCMDPEFRIPATVSLPRALAMRPEGARSVISALNKITNAKDRCGTGGVAKLGYSWEALDVKRWTDEKQLARVLQQLCGHVYIDNNLTGQSHMCDTVICQEFIPHLAEMRCYVVEHVIRKFVWTKFERVDDQMDFKEFEQAKDDADACTRWFDGDEEKLGKAKAEAEKLCARWLVWLEAQTCESIPAIRFDLFVKDDGTVITAEICECGFSMLYDEVLPYKVFTALADKARPQKSTR